MVIDQLTIIKAKSDKVLLSVKVLIDIFQRFVHALSLATNKSQSTLSIWQEMSKTPYDNCKKLVNTLLKFNSKKIIFWSTNIHQ